LTRRRGRKGNVDGKQSLTQNQHQRSQRLMQANETGLTGKVYHELEYGSSLVFAHTESIALFRSRLVERRTRDGRLDIKLCFDGDGGEGGGGSIPAVIGSRLVRSVEILLLVSFLRNQAKSAPSVRYLSWALMAAGTDSKPDSYCRPRVPRSYLFRFCG